MSKLNLTKNSVSATSTQSFREASAEELRVLIALTELDGGSFTLAELARSAGVSVARARAATALWQAEGLFDDGKPEEKAPANNVKDEFPERFSSELYEETAIETANTVRDAELAELLTECAALMGKPALTTAEVKKITSLYSQLSLSEEFIFTLAAHLAEQNKLSATMLAKKAEKLVESGIDTIEALGVYIEDDGRESGTDREFRRIFGIYNRNLSKTEREYFKKWSEDYSFDVEIVSEAYGILTKNNSASGISLPYIDKILTRWHECGCTTLAACRAQCEIDKKELSGKKADGQWREKPDKKPKFVNFDVNEVFKRALERSYGNEEKDN
ncbi:MAG: DnaD domain protein [Clostridia bacterium]|nr:DnaD domain protein [Clostridia bacterium]